MSLSAVWVKVLALSEVEGLLPEVWIKSVYPEPVEGEAVSLSANGITLSGVNLIIPWVYDQG